MSDDDEKPPVSFALAAKFLEHTVGHDPQDVFFAAVLLARYAAELGQQPQGAEMDKFLLDSFHAAPVDVHVVGVGMPPRSFIKKVPRVLS